jgi:hypothetical protein
LKAWDIFILKWGVPNDTPKTFASADRAMTQPSLLDETTVGFPRNWGWKTCSQEA